MLFAFTQVISVNGSNTLLFDLHSVRWKQMKSELILSPFLFLSLFFPNPAECVGILYW